MTKSFDLQARRNHEEKILENREAGSGEGEATPRTALSDHTPGPWFAVLNSANFYDICIEDRQYARSFASVYCSPHIPNGSNHGANADLIAAAPDLLFALQQIHDDTAEYGRINNLGIFDNHVMRVARAAIAKALGTNTQSPNDRSAEVSHCGSPNLLATGAKAS